MDSLSRADGLPVETAWRRDPAPRADDAAPRAAAADQPAAPHVLVADEEPATLRAMTWLLRDRGYEVTAVPAGRLLLEEMACRTPDVLLLDVGFREADGFQLLERIRADERWHDLPVLILSSRAPDDLAVRTLGLGAADFIRKPFGVREVLARIEAHLRVRSALRSTRETVRSLEAELQRARAEADTRRALVDIVNDLHDEQSSAEIYQTLARRVARTLGLTRCSVLLARRGGTTGVLVADIEGAPNDLQVDLSRYPELRAALEYDRPVLVEDVRTSPLYDEVRRRWAAEGTRVPVRSVIAVPFAADRLEPGVFFLRRGEGERPLTPADVEFAGTVIRAAMAAVERARVIENTRADNRRLEALALTDPLTEVLNRRALTDRLSVEIDRARRYGTVLSLLMLDLDHFKSVNDTYGHQVGDEVLASLAALLQHAVRSVDVVARYGGEEFVVVLPETGEPGAVTFAERIRERIEQHEFARIDGRPLTLTASIGVASFPSARVDSAEELVGRADQALYRAKSEGRNRVRG